MKAITPKILEELRSHQISYICAMTNLQNNEMKNSYILHCRSLCRIVIRPLHLDYVKHGMILNTQQLMVKGLPTMGVESISYTDTKDIHIG
jgi:hypothetical protein